MSAADPHTDDLADRLDKWADTLVSYTGFGEIGDDFRAAAAELRRLRQRDADLTRLLDAVGDPEGLKER